MKHPELLNKFRLAFSDAVKGQGRLSVNAQVKTRIDGRWVKGGMEPGSPDLLGIVKTKQGWGLSVAVEIKTANDDLRPDQIRWLKNHQRLGGVALVVHPKTCDAIVDWLQSVVFDGADIFNPKSVNPNAKLSNAKQINSIHLP